MYYTPLVPPEHPLLLDAVKRGAGVSVHGGQCSAARDPPELAHDPPEPVRGPPEFAHRKLVGIRKKGELTLGRLLNVAERLPIASEGP